MRGYLKSGLMLAATIVAVAGPVQAAVLINSDFNAAALGTVADGAFGEFTAKSAANTAITVVDLGGGDRAVTLTDNSAIATGTGTPPYLLKTVSGLSTNAIGDNHITGSFEFTRLTRPNGGTEGSFRFLLNRAGTNNYNAVAAETLVLLRVVGNQISYGNGTISGTNVPTTGLGSISLALDTTYIFELDVDLSSISQDTWLFRVKNSAGTVLYTSPTLNTSAVNATPGHFLFTGGITAAAASPDPFVRLDDISFSAVPIPEPASMALLGLGVLAMAFPHRGRRE